MAESANMKRVESLAATLPEATRVDIEAWGGEPTFRVRGKNFIFADNAMTVISVKLSKDEAAAVVGSDPSAEPTGYGLGRHGWISVLLDPDLDDERWAEVEEWILTSYCLVAPKTLARKVLEPVEDD